MAKTSRTRRPRKAAAEEVAPDEADPIVGGELATPEEKPSLGQSIDWVRSALQPHDPETRKSIIRAANQLMK